MPIAFIAYFYGLWNKNFFEKNFWGGFKILGGCGKKKYFLKVNNFFTLISVEFLILYLNSLFFFIPTIYNRLYFKRILRKINAYFERGFLFPPKLHPSINKKNYLS